jgi:cell division protein FtsZ
VGGDHAKGRKAAEQNRDEIRECLSGADMVFITAGMGGGSGTGAAPIVAEISKEMGALTIAVVTKPFAFEGAHRREVGEDGLEQLLEKVDTLIVIPNDRLLSLCDNKTAVGNAFKMADDVLRHAVQAIAEVITVPGVINLDFADVKAVMQDAGPAWMSIGYGTGQNRAIDSAKAALASPLLDVSVDGAKGVLFNVCGGESLTLFEVNEAAEIIGKAVDPDANIIFGVVFDSRMDNELRLTLVATGFTSKKPTKVRKDEELRQLLKTMESEHELDVPTFLRQPQARRRAVEGPAIGQHSPQHHATFR